MKYTPIVVRIRAKSQNRDHDYWQPQCDCGWRGAYYSNRTIEGRSVATDHAAQHRCKGESA